MRRWQDTWSRRMNHEGLALGHLCYMNSLVNPCKTQTVDCDNGRTESRIWLLVVGTFRVSEVGLRGLI